jgi:hypothetical protein
VIATGRMPASAYATRWQSAMMKPAPTQPMPGTGPRGSGGRWSGAGGEETTVHFISTIALPMASPTSM